MISATVDEMRCLIESATSYGDPLDQIERDMIEPTALSDDAKSGLWLYAWAGAGLRRGRPLRALGGTLAPGD